MVIERNYFDRNDDHLPWFVKQLSILVPEKVYWAIFAKNNLSNPPAPAVLSYATNRFSRYRFRNCRTYFCR